MLRKLSFAFVTVALVVGCAGKKKSTDIDSSTISTPTSDTAVESTPMSFDASGSDSGRIPGLETVHFEYDKSNISAENKSILQANSEWIKKNPTYKVQIEGHCDSRGTIEYNLALGE
ncbi:MAG: peptidoglycan-associated lipoprotein, partial [Proteobacteria bacterium]